uniref:Uncharacterized protein n=1 Tax=Rhizophora mucronata TaxID=61149 RepID=A0A2P2QG22_RHIMU
MLVVKPDRRGFFMSLAHGSKLHGYLI